MNKRIKLHNKFKGNVEAFDTRECSVNVFGRIVRMDHGTYKGTIHTQSGCLLPKNQVVFDSSCDDFKLAGTDYFDFKHSY